MQHRRPVGIQHALGVARGPRGVAQRRGGVFIQLRPVISVGGGLHQVVIAQQVRDFRLGGHVRAVCHGDEMPDRLVAMRRCLDQRQKGQVEAQNLVARVVGNPDQLVGVQARVQRVQDQA